MEIKSRRKFSKEFKEDVVNMINVGDKKVSELAKELGIADAVIYRWYRKSNKVSPKEAERLSDQEKEVRSLRLKLAEVMEERDILKKALNIFSKQGT